MRNKATHYLKILSVSLLMAIVGCVAANQLSVLEALGRADQLPIYKERPIKFGHASHVEGTEADLACTDCHTRAEDSDQAGMPSIKACRNCHSEKEDIEKNLKPFAVDKKIVWTSATALSEDAQFSHQNHLGAEVACEDCHQGVTESKAVSAKFKVEKDDCLVCHSKQEKAIKGACNTCHESVDQDWQPDSHLQNWKMFHGQVARAGIDPPYENRCSLCHTDSACLACHQDEEPRSHTSHWRNRSHGIAAGMDRDSCATCHRTDYCDRCHRETEPMSHRASWGAPRDRHCMTCHLPLESQGCSACHESAPSHYAAPGLPSTITHMTATESACRTCHGLGLTHLDNGDACRNCHY
jgi:hypothetical protein